MPSLCYPRPQRDNARPCGPQAWPAGTRSIVRPHERRSINGPRGRGPRAAGTRPHRTTGLLEAAREGNVDQPARQNASAFCWDQVGSSGWTRTSNPPVNRRPRPLIHTSMESDQVLRLEALRSAADRTNPPANGSARCGGSSRPRTYNARRGARRRAEPLSRRPAPAAGRAPSPALDARVDGMGRGDVCLLNDRWIGFAQESQAADVKLAVPPVSIECPQRQR